MEGSATTVMWRLYKPAGGGHVRAVILPGGPPFTLAFFANDAMDRVENYDTTELAIFRADEIKRSLLSEGWQED